MVNDKILASVGILTLNSAAGLPKTLASVKAFDDIYICDGNSTDGTQEIARSYGARVTKQFDHDIPNSRLDSFGEARTKCFKMAKYDWYVRVDSDEELSPEVVEEIRKIVIDPNPKFWIYKMPRKYVWQDKVIDRTITYPNRQIRFFHKKAVNGFIKVTHERVDMKPGFEIGMLKGAQLVPLPDDYLGYWKKFESGLRFDIKQYGIGISIWRFVNHTFNNIVFTLRLLLRLFRARLLPGQKLPFVYDWARIKYQLMAERVLVAGLINYYSPAKKEIRNESLKKKLKI